MELLIIEQNESTKELIKKRLKNDFVIETTSLGEEGLELAKIYDYSLIILGRMLADSDGYQVLKQLRSQKINSPLLFLTSLNNADLKIKALQYGADDCMSVPFNSEELEERVKLLIQHKGGHVGGCISVGRITIVPKYFRVLVDDQIIHFPKKEYEILEFLCLNKNKIITKDQILDHIYLNEADKKSGSCLPVWLNSIRKKLRNILKKDPIAHIYMRGYMISDQE